MSPDRFSVNGTGPIKKGKRSLPERSRQADEALANRCDDLGQLWAEAEKKLKALKPPRPVWTTYGHTGSEGGPTAWELLGIAKVKGQWRVCHAHDHENNDDGPLLDVQPIIECPREVRIEAAKHVRELHGAIVRAKEEYVQAADAAIAELTEALSEM